jgi:hypothetical protein
MKCEEDHDMSNSKAGGGNKGSANDTGKHGNASGSHVKEARGPSYKPPASDQEHSGKHPPNKIYTGPKDMQPHVKTGSRQSDKG